MAERVPDLLAWLHFLLPATSEEMGSPRFVPSWFPNLNARRMTWQNMTLNADYNCKPYGHHECHTGASLGTREISPKVASKLAKRTGHVLKILQRRVLYLKGVKVSVVDKVMGPMRSNWADDCPEDVIESGEFPVKTKYQAFQSAMMDRFIKIFRDPLLAKVQFFRLITGRRRPFEESWNGMTCEELWASALKAEQRYADFWEFFEKKRHVDFFLAFSCIDNQYMVSTAGGPCGLGCAGGPLTPRKGDIACVFWGCPILFLIRASQTFPGEYELVAPV
ncbi:hypothetical protein B0T16DRAFT_396097 [Cercophora newfieldiana]|uniref:Uncharacterized protein n=1 Tax=Cercophora newfieldiana TaxID=92897 RepID=A0AA39YM26_9PEZI|nr:hypothetical protein B0T16DRAFT_396097 [Cercophora newfieldiana]